MCGIVGVTGTESVLPILLEGLARLEYRGYDSAGVALSSRGRLWRRRRKGRLAALAAAVTDAPTVARAGIGHTRWATHGRPDERNAHPHIDCSGALALVHNGIVENHRELRAKLEAGGHVLGSDTDTEVLAHLIEDGLASGTELASAVRAAMGMVEGTFALAVMHADDPDLLVVTRRGSPLIIGRSADAGFVASDIPALLPYTGEVFALADDEVVEMRGPDLLVRHPEGAPLRPERRGLGWDASATELAGYPHFMLKEIHQQPHAVAATLGGRRYADAGIIADAGLSTDDLAEVRRVLLVGCGTSLHAGLAARPAIEAWGRVAVECETASELRSRSRVIEPSTLVVAISQSGESIDTLLAMRDAVGQGVPVLALTNVVGSAIAREAGAPLYTQAGPEIGVAATKTHVAQVAGLLELALTLGAARGTLATERRIELGRALRELPDCIEEVLRRRDHIFSVAARYVDARDFFFLGRGPGYAVALEGALKLKETAYLRAEGYAAGEMKHGPIALVQPGVVVVGVVGTGEVRTKMLSNIAEMRTRGATVVLVATDGDEDAAEVADDVLFVPSPPDDCSLISPVVDVVPLQLFSYAIASALGCDVDKPRNLAKTVTVE